MKTKIITLNILMLLLLQMNTQAQTWKRHTAKEANFKINFPSQVKVHQDSKVYMASTKYIGTGYKVVAVLNKDFGSHYDKLLDKNIEGFITKNDKVEKRNSSLRVNGYPAKEVYIRSASNTCILYRVIATPNTLYQILVTKKLNYESQANLNKFVNSFEIIR